MIQKSRPHWPFPMGAVFCLFQFLFQTPEQRGMEKLFDGDAQPVAQLLDGGHGGAAVAAADDVVHRGLGHAAHAAQLIDGEVPLPAQFQNAFSHRFTNVHGHHLTFKK